MEEEKIIEQYIFYKSDIYKKIKPPIKEIDREIDQYYPDPNIYYKGSLFTGIFIETISWADIHRRQVVMGLEHGISVYFDLINNKIVALNAVVWGYSNTGYSLRFNESGEVVFFMIGNLGDQLHEIYLKGIYPTRLSSFKDSKHFTTGSNYLTNIERNKSNPARYEEDGYFEVENNFLPYFEYQFELGKKANRVGEIPKNTKYLAGLSFVFSEITLEIATSIVILDLENDSILESYLIKEEMYNVYLPHYYSFREAKLYHKLLQKCQVTPDLILCNGYGLNHPVFAGVAVQMGVETQIPTISCFRKRIIESYDKTKLGNNRGDFLPTTWDEEEVGVALRVVENENPVFVSIGNNVSIENAKDFILKLTEDTNYPKVLNEAEKLLENIFDEILDFDPMQDLMQFDDFGI